MTSNSKAIAGSASAGRSNYAVQATPPQALRGLAGKTSGGRELGMTSQDEASQRGGASSTEANALDMFYVEATPTQIEATLAGLAAQPDQFLAVSVAPAPGIQTQTRWRQYGYDNYSNGRHQFFRQDGQMQQPLLAEEANSPAQFPESASPDASSPAPSDLARMRKAEAEARASQTPSDHVQTFQSQASQAQFRRFHPTGSDHRGKRCRGSKRARASIAQQARVSETQSNLRTKSDARPGPTAPSQQPVAAGQPTVESSAPQTSGGAIAAVPQIATVRKSPLPRKCRGPLP